jgi:hypothetical protein
LAGTGAAKVQLIFQSAIDFEKKSKKVFHNTPKTRNNPHNQVIAFFRREPKLWLKETRSQMPNA